jgi:hypothetical protein
MRKHCGLLIVLACMAACAETRISGDIQGIVFEPGNNPYIVEKDIFVPEGKEIEIPAGVVFLFSSFTGLTVHGHIRVLGTTDNPVVFTSVFDSKYNPASTQLPNPFDWNGILVSNTSVGSYFNNFSLCFSVYGIKSQSQNVVIQNGVFRQNGQFHFTIHDQIQFVQDNIPYSYGTKAKSGSTDEAGAKKAAKKAKRAKGGGKVSRQTKIVRFACLSVGIAGTGLGTIFAIRAARRANELNSWNVYSQQSDLYDKTDQERVRAIAGAGVSYGIGALGFIGFAVSFAF